ncbi:uncharacterized protein CcaverHIS019_0505450 [Cutaneotrichosporon cavernicola]|uniref:C2H2-type domain-containing protein n=1 Tax=Cutaneotrichosporon cavernicola TaxID=279322 RepID=A0AA48L6N1_9TREE|nr:uncharacterized protein CcaverHIS019_0505450 [Cutaneotrichosporon cavernicola]BEI92917.1 hypothetical protein CcaverHIS019_0505450 [Cutaneotrichosporon cavernicola]
MQDPSQGLYSDSQTQSTYPPTGPATFPSPAQNAATVLDRSATPSSSRPILGSPTSQTRTSLHGRRDSVQQSFSQLRMFAHKFETARGSPEQPRPSATPQVNTTAASPPQSWAQQPQVTTASSTGIPLAHGVQQLWSRQLLTPSGTAPTAQLQAPQGAVSPQALSTVPRPSEESGSAVPQRPLQASALGHAPRQASQASPRPAPPAPVRQRPAQYAAPISQRPETQVAPPAVRSAQVDAVSALSAGPARQSAARPPAARPSTPAPGPAEVAKLPAPHAQAARPPAAAQTAVRPPRPIPIAPRPVASLAGQTPPATPAAPGRASPGHAPAPTTPRTPNGTRLVPISASQVSTPRKAVNISSGHSEGYVRREEMAGAGPVYVIAKASERVWNSQHSQSSQDPQAAQVRTPETQASAAAVAPSAMRFGAGNDAPRQARPWPSHPTVTTHPAARPVPEAGPSQPGLTSQPAPSTAPAPTATAAQAPTDPAARPSSQPAAAASPTPASQPPKIGRPPGTGKLQIAAGGEREAATGTLASTSNGTSKTPVASPSALDAPGPQAAAHAQPKRIGPINRAMVVVPISRTRREQLIARGVYDPFRDDADPYLEPERVSRRPRAAQTYPVTKIISASISRGTAQRIREPEVIKDRFAHPPEPPMREPFKSVLARDSLLNRLGNYVCEWKGCEAEMASESKLLRHVLARNHAGQAAFTFGNLELYKCYWGNCDSASFRTAGKLEQHMLAMHVCEKLVCPYEDCHLRSSTISHLYRHVVRNHEDGDQPRPRVDCPSEAALSPPEALPASIATVELTTLPALGKSYRTERYQELAHAKVLKMCVAPENPEIHVVHPLHMLEVIGNEDENIAETREASPQGGKRGDAEEETEEERETPSEEIVLLVEAAIVQDPLQRKRKDASLPGPDGGTKRAMARRTGGDPVTPRSSQRVATQRKVKTEAVRITRRQTARRTGAVGSPIPVSDGSSRGSKDNGQGGRGDSKGVEWARSGRGRGQRMVIECIEVPRIDTSGYQRMDK